MTVKTLQILLFLCAVGLIAPACTQSEPKETPAREAPNPAEAQALPESPLVISSGDQAHRFTVELADDDAERSTGLMHRAQMNDDHGMLFDFHTPRRVAFWMRNTFIPLDMIFIKSDGEIVSIFENVPPLNDNTVGPERPVRAVLELNAGEAAKRGLKVGVATNSIKHTSVTMLGFAGILDSLDVLVTNGP